MNQPNILAQAPATNPELLKAALLAELTRVYQLIDALNKPPDHTEGNHGP